MPPEEPAVDGSVMAVAERIQARREAGNAPKPEGSPPEGLRDVDDPGYRPGKNIHADEQHSDDDEDVSPEQLRREALGEDDEPGQDDQDEEQVDDDEQELEASADEDEQPDADDEDHQDVELAFESVDELAGLLGMDVDTLLSRVKIGTLVDGEAGEITLADLRKGHQLESSFTRKNQAFLDRQKSFETESEKQRTQTADHFAQATAVLNTAQQQLYADFHGVDWNALQNSNPQDWAVKRQQFGERQARLNQVMASTTQQLEKATTEQKSAQDEAQNRQLDEQHDLLMAAVPTWKKDEKIRQKQGTQIAEYLVTMGYSPEEISDLKDHRLILLGRAALGLAGPSKRKLALAQKKIDKVQNLVKPGNGQTRRAQGKTAFTKKAQDAQARLKKSGSTEDAAAALLARKQARAASQKRGRRSRV